MEKWQVVDTFALAIFKHYLNDHLTIADSITAQPRIHSD